MIPIVNQRIRRIEGVLTVVAGLFLATAVFAIPIYAVFMVVWMHAPLVPVIATTAPLALVLALATFFVIRAGWRLMLAGS